MLMVAQVTTRNFVKIVLISIGKASEMDVETTMVTHVTKGKVMFAIHPW
jgi:hypothetical protein